MAVIIIVTATTNIFHMDFINDLDLHGNRILNAGGIDGSIESAEKVKNPLTIKYSNKEVSFDGSSKVTFDLETAVKSFMSSTGSSIKIINPLTKLPLSDSNGEIELPLVGYLQFESESDAIKFLNTYRDNIPNGLAVSIMGSKEIKYWNFDQSNSINGKLVPGKLEERVTSLENNAGTSTGGEGSVGVLTYSNSQKLSNPTGDFDLNETFDNVPITSIITRLIYGYTKPSLTLTGTNSGNIEVGSITSGVLTLNITKGSRELDNTLDQTSELSFKSKVGIQTQTIDFSTIKTVQSKSYYVTVYDKKSPRQSATGRVSYNFLLRRFHGTSNEIPSSINETGDLASKGEFSYSYTSNGSQFYWFAIPKEWNAVIRVIDPNQFDITDSFLSKEVQYTNKYNIESTYKIYYSKVKSILNNFKVTIKM